MKELLKKLNACQPAIEWAGDKTWEEIYKTCHRGDWLLWLFKKTMEDNEANLRLLTLAKGHCAATVLHLMKDEKSINAVKVAIAFGEGNASREDLNAAYAIAVDVADATATVYATAYAAAFAVDVTDADVAADVAAYAASAAYAAYADDATATFATAYADADATAKKQNQMETADICRKYLPIEIWNIGGNK